MPNSDFFACALCRTLVETDSKEEVSVSYDKANDGWRIICDTCFVELANKGIPAMRISYGLLAEKVTHGKAN